MDEMILQRLDRALVDRARALVPLVQDDNPLIRVKLSDVVRMALSTGLDLITADLQSKEISE